MNFFLFTTLTLCALSSGNTCDSADLATGQMKIGCTKYYCTAGQVQMSFTGAPPTECTNTSGTLQECTIPNCGSSGGSTTSTTTSRSTSSSSKGVGAGLAVVAAAILASFV